MSKRLATCLLFTLAATAAAAGESQQDVRVSLELPNATILPGVPFDLAVVYKNNSDRPMAIGATAHLIIAPVNGARTRFDSFTHVDGVGLTSRQNFELQPGETQTGTVSWHANWFYEDAAFTKPGAYDIALELIGDPSDAEEEGFSYAGTITTPPVRLTRLEPRDEDAEVWDELQKAAGRGWPSHGFGSRATRENMGDIIVARHPKSSYYPYALLLGHGVPLVPLGIARAAVERFTDSPAYAHLLLLAGNAAKREALQRLQNHAAPDEVANYFRAAVEFDESAAKSGNPAVREQARMNESIAREGLEQLRRNLAQKP